MKIRMSKSTQKKIIEEYKRKNELTWKEMAKKFNLGESTLRYFFRYGMRPIPKSMFDEISKKRVRHEIIDKQFINRRKSVNKTKKHDKNIFIKKYGKEYFSIIGKKGSDAQKTSFKWTDDIKLKHSAFGRIGGNLRIKNSIYLTEQEKGIIEENKRLKLNFRSNAFLDDQNNFDFIYYDKKENVMFIEEACMNSYRALAYFLEKRKFLDEMFSAQMPLLVTYKNSKPEIDEFLLNMNIIPVKDLETRRNIIKMICGGKSNGAIEDIVRQTIENNKKDYRFISCLKNRSDKYEKLVDWSLKKFKPKGKVIFTGKYGSKYIPDNFIEYGGKNIVVLVSACKTRGSLFYSFFNHSSQSIIYEKMFSLPVFSIIFDFSNTSASYSQNKPKQLWEKYCKYRLIVNKDKLKYLNNDAISIIVGG